MSAQAPLVVGAAEVALELGELGVGVVEEGDGDGGRLASAAMRRLSVVIPTFERDAILARVLDRLGDQTAGPDAFEVVVAVDAAHGPPDGVERVVGERPYTTLVVQARTAGVSAARNRGWRAAREPVVLFLGDDMLPAPDLVERHLAFHVARPEPEAGTVGHVRWADELPRTAFMDWLDEGMQFDFGSIRGDRAAWWHFYACNASVKRELVERVDGFDETFRWGYEELDLALRMTEHGFALVYTPAAEVEHLHPPTLEAWRERMRVVAGAERQFVAKHPQAEAYFLKRFERAEAEPPARARGAQLARLVPRGLPWIGARVHFSADRWFSQQLAPSFLEAWREAEPGR